MGAYFGTQNTNCLTYIPENVKLTLDPLNVKITGSPTVSSGVVSGFSASNYLTLPDIFTPGTKSWEYVIKIKFSSVSGTEYFFGSKNYVMPLIGRVGNRFKIWISTNGSSWNFAAEKSGTYTVLVDTYYWIKMKFTGSAYILSYSTDGSTFTDDINVSGTATIKGGSAPVIGYGWTDNPLTTGTVDLTACYIKIGGTTTWQGGTGKITLKKGSKVYIPNGYTSYKYYKATYGSWTRPNLTSNTSNTSFTLVDPKLSGGTLSGTTMTWGTAAVTRFTDVWKSFDNSTSTYFTINNGNQTFTVFDIIFSDYMKVSGVTITGKVVDSQASSLTGSQIYALTDSEGWKLLSTKTDKDVNTHTFTGVRTNKLRICARPNTDGGSYPSRLTNITITAQKQTGGTESTSSDYDYKVGSGSMIFDEVVISKDKILTEQWGTINDSMFLYYRNNGVLGRLSVNRSISGATDTYTGSYSRVWYNTTNNTIKFVNADGTVTDTRLLSLPLCIFTAEGYNSSAVKSIDQIFNGFGYIGSHMFRHKGIKFLAPNGFKDDESYNSTEVETTGILLKEQTAVNPYTWYNLITKDAWYNNTEYYIRKTAPSVSTNAYWYNTAENKMYRWSGSKWEQRLGVIVGTTVTSNKKVQSMSIKKVQPAKRGLPVKGIYLGSQNTNCLTYIPNDINLSLDPLNVTVVGSPTVSSGVVSNFSSANYITTTKNFTPGSSIWEWMLKINMSQVSGTQLMFGGKNHEIPLIGIVGSKFRLFLSSNGTSWNIASGTYGTHTLTVDTNYWVKLRFTGSAYILSYSTDGSTFTDDITVSSTATQVGGYPLIIGYGWTDNPTTKGTVDLSGCYIKIGGTTTWRGGTGKLTLKKGSKVYVPNGYTSYKYYKYTYENWTQPVATAATTAIDGGDMVITATNQYSSSYPWRAMDGNITNSAWVMNETTKGYWQLKLPYKIVITGLTFYNTQGKNRTNTGRFYTSSAKTTPIGNEFTATNSDFATTVISGIPSTGIETDTIYLDLTSSTGSSSGMGELKITAKRKTGSVESTSSDYDYKVGSGSMIFDEVVISSDKAINNGWNDKRFLFIDSGKNLAFEQIAHSYSGDNPPTDTNTYLYWYDTKNNLIKTSDNKGESWAYVGHSLPIAIVTTGLGSITSIDQVFNGFGYIGSHAFVLPNVKALVANGFNTDGTYKSKEWAVDKVLLTDGKLYSDANSLIIRNHLKDLRYGNYRGSFSANPQLGGSHGCYYNHVENIFYAASATSQNNEEIFLFGSMTNDGSKITSLTPNKVQPEKTVIDVSRIYRGATLIYGYGVNDVLFESSTSGTYSLNIKQSGNYEITIVGAGGGGGGSAGSHAWMGANGGSGAVFKGVVNLSKSMITINVGEGGTGGNSSGANAPGGQNGTDSSVNFGSGKLITAGAGRGGHGTGDYGSSNTGAGGTLTITGITTVSTSINQNGVTSSDVSILGNNTGAGGVSTSGKAGTKGQNGYVKIVAL